MPTAADIYPVQLEPPDNYFTELTPEQLPRGTDITIGGPNGPDEAMGYFVHWDSCIESASHTACYLAPRSPSGYQAFHQGHVITATGSRISTGVIGSKGHALPGSTVQEAQEFYQYPEWAKLRGRVYENEIGAYFHGQLQPGVTYGDVEMIRSSALSGHWQYRERMVTASGQTISGIDCLGPTLVARPGAPLDGDDRVSFASFALLASAADGTMNTFYSIPAGASMNDTPTTTSPVVAPIMFDRDGLRYTQTSAGTYEAGPIPAESKACCGGGCHTAGDEPATTAAAGSLDAAATQAEVDEIVRRVDELERMFTRMEGDRMSADDVALMDVA